MNVSVSIFSTWPSGALVFSNGFSVYQDSHFIDLWKPGMEVPGSGS